MNEVTKFILSLYDIAVTRYLLFLKVNGRFKLPGIEAARLIFKYLEYICKLNDTKIEIVDNSTISKEQELTEDLIQIITVFANRLYGAKSKKTINLIKSVKENADR